MTTEEKIIEDNWDKFLEMYWCQKCNGCPNGHNSHWKTVITSPQWKKWKEYAEPKMLYDFPENEELGIMSEQHFQDFLEFTLQQHGKEVEHCSEPNCPECNLVAYNKGKADMLEEVKEKIENGMSYCEVLDSNEKRRGYDIAYVEIVESLKSLQRNDSEATLTK